ncbi:PREDICTED: SAFB-like transcription modulator isoform X2 [Ceratosolen solmsi marchali]|uniref:SAFB-like transcription modulator isoform X2 n=1 Tax=Ceratosolen solmsi marchali TaxID=326594 RepID=A0AAJ6YLA6_9HYME|nr:PREDICTED: SAFB-like transcription modulator isoform X2 [Ceratosolen solmsi marchali]
MADVEGKKLTELRVIDLKTELERRGLDKTGNKAALLERLAKAIIEEGGNPDECLIIPCGGVSRVSPKKPIDTSIMIEDALETEIQKDEFHNDFGGLDKPTPPPPVIENIPEEPVINITAQPEELEMEYKEIEPEPTVTAIPTEEPIPEKKPFIASEESSNVSTIEANGIDNEDSINLTIGEDEENLLVEESESNDRLKDGGAKKRLEESNNSINNNINSSNNKKGDSKGSGRAESSASSKEGTSLASGPNATGLKSKQDGEGCKSGDPLVKAPKRDEKDKSITVSINASSRNLWVSGLSSTTRATDLKQIFSKYGKVVGAKVVTNARTPGARCYGYVTMSTSDDAEKCIQYLHRTELHGRVISVEKAKGDSQQNHNRKRDPLIKVDKKDEKEKIKDVEPIEKEAEKHEDENKSDELEKETEDKEGEEGIDREKRESSLENKDEGSLKDCDTRSTKSNSKKPDRERANSREDKKRSWDRSRTSRSKSRERHRRDNVLSFAKIKEERERQRLREKERLLREEKRRRREDIERQRAIEREAARLEREREKLCLERERIEQEKAELLRFERERQKVEREKLERERLELKRQQMRLEENRRVPPPPALKRTSSDRREPRDVYVEPERKRINVEHPNRRHSPPERVNERRADVMERVSDRRMDTAPVPSRYDGVRSKEMGMQKNFKRGNDFASRNNREDQFNEVPRGGRDVMVRRDSRPNQNSMDHRQVKERYERPSTFGRDREIHRSDDNHRSSRDNHNRYDNSKPNNQRDGRYVDNNRQTGWHSGPPSKPFNSVNNRNEQSGWNSRSSDSRVNSRWNNSNNMGNNMGHPRSQMYQGGGPNQSFGGMSQGNSGSYERFDPYKGSMQNMRKY